MNKDYSHLNALSPPLSVSLSLLLCKSPWCKGLDGKIRCLSVASENKDPSPLPQRTSILSPHPSPIFQPVPALSLTSPPILFITHAVFCRVAPVDCRTPAKVRGSGKKKKKKWTRSDLGQWFR